MVGRRLPVALPILAALALSPALLSAQVSNWPMSGQNRQHTGFTLFFGLERGAARHSHFQFPAGSNRSNARAVDWRRVRMEDTSVTLLNRIKSGADEVAWSRFVEIYAPLLMSWVTKRGLQTADAADLVQEILLVLLRELPTFRYDSNGSFRGWLRTLAANSVNGFFRRRGVADRMARDEGLETVACKADDEFWDREYRTSLFRRAIDVMQVEFEPTTWQAALLATTTDRRARDIGTELGISEAAVHQAKSRVLRRLRSELSGLWE